MQDYNNNEYYCAREQQEIALANRATNPDIAAIHRDMATRYAALVFETAQPATRLMAVAAQ